MCNLPADLVSEMNKEAEKRSAITIKPEGTISFNDYMWSMMLACRYAMKHCKSFPRE